MNILELSEQEIIRRNNLQQLRDLGINPYPAAEYPTNAFSTEIKESFVDLPIVGKDEEGNDIRETATPENSRQVCIASVCPWRCQYQTKYRPKASSKSSNATSPGGVHCRVMPIIIHGNSQHTAPTPTSSSSS